MPNALVHFWKDCQLDRPPFAHPSDCRILQKYGAWPLKGDPIEFKSYIASPRFADSEDAGLHLSLLPVPYIGDIENAEVVVLLLNPGFEHSDYWAETKVPEFRKRLEQNLRQSFEGVDYPFLYLDPQFCWHSGFRWWERKLRKVIQRIASSRFNGNYREALRFLSQKIACIEMVPYHSASFEHHKLIGELPSALKACSFVQDSLRVKNSKKTWVVTRKVKHWAIAKSDTVIVYEGGQTRGASLSPESEGGGAILRRFEID